MEDVETTEDKEARYQRLFDAKLPDNVTEETIIREEGDYMKRQPRVDMKAHGNYNYE
jgi:hypothetical protein